MLSSSNRRQRQTRNRTRRRAPIGASVYRHYPPSRDAMAIDERHRRLRRTTLELFTDAWARLDDYLRERGKNARTFPNGLATMWFYITEDRAEADRILEQLLVPVIHRPEGRTPRRPTNRRRARTGDMRVRRAVRLVWAVVGVPGETHGRATVLDRALDR